MKLSLSNKKSFLSLRKIITFSGLVFFLISSTTSVVNNDTTSSDNSFWENVRGEPTPSALYLGMVTVHLNLDSQRNDNWNTQLLGEDYKAYFSGTLINSFGDRTRVFGLQPYVFSQEISNDFNQNIGYRLGVISGYDQRITPAASETPL